MPISNQLKPILDLPVFEWPRALPSTPGSTSGWSASVRKGNRWIYYLNATLLFKYDTYGDSWTQLASLPITPSGVLDLKVIDQDGYRSRLISQPNPTTIRVAGVMSGMFEGSIVKVYQSGTGQGQEKTIISETLNVYDSGTVNVASTTSIVDTNKVWTINQWRGYQVRLVYGVGSMQIRKVISNSSNTLVLSDATYVNYDRDALGSLTVSTSITAGATTGYQIEATDMVIDSAFVTPIGAFPMLGFNTTSVFCTTGTSAAPFILMYRYDVITDVWYQCVTNNSFSTSTLGNDLSMASTGSYRDVITTKPVTSATTLAVNINVGTQPFLVNEFNNFLVRISAGTGIGQERQIMSNTINQLVVKNPWDIIPDSTSVMQILPDYDKFWVIGNSQSLMSQYSIRENIWSNSYINEVGIARSGSVGFANDPNLILGINTGVRSGVIATIATIMLHPFRVGDVVTLNGAAQAQYNGTFTITSVPSTTTFTYNMVSDPLASASYPAQSTSVIVDTCKNWAVNSLVGKTVLVNSGSTSAQVTNQIRRILSNTANTITIAGTTISSAVSGLSKYAIIDNDCFGAVEGGTASSGSTTTIVDTTKNWLVNNFAGLRVRFSSGLLIGQESFITSNTANTIVLTSTLSITVDSSTGYAILPIQARSSGIITKYCYGYKEPNKTYGGKFIYSFRGGSTTHVDRYNIASNSWERFTAFPFNADVFTIGTSYAYDGNDNFMIFNGLTHRIFQYNLKTNRLTMIGMAPYTVGASLIGNRADIVETEDGLKYFYINRLSSIDMFRTLLFLPSNF